MDNVADITEYARRAPNPRGLRRVNGCATVTALRSSSVHPDEAENRRARVQRIVDYFDVNAPRRLVTAAKVRAIDEEAWSKIAEYMDESHPISRITRRQVISFLEERENAETQAQADFEAMHTG